ncbi:hypothetical protein Bhyg_15818 [Pseudolycoriella hygida]|uniref:Uncharacterized protein n=1 Tax=Pseudolycoriella hygida TaxID=35572 RepID=A0A9Q0MJR1_9DIPT|nr:hypothetical protein Bhyg_15818 [Pseudolycoriella hygida]
MKYVVPIILDNKLYVLTEQLSRHIVDTKLSFLIPYPIVSDGTNGLSQPNIQCQPNPTCNSMSGNVEQQLRLNRMHAQYEMDLMNSLANQQSLASNASTFFPMPHTFLDASRRNGDLTPQCIDVEMQTV